MRINSLVIAGFGPYRHAQHVDFDAFADDGIFLISGKTGAGKSSILDAVCFALYNAVPRYEGTDKQLRSHHCAVDDPSYVTLEFSVGDTRYQVWRTPEYERPAKKGGGLTTQKPDARLFVWRPAAASPAAASVRGSKLPFPGGGKGDMAPLTESSAGEGGGHWEGIAARPVDVGHELSRILGLSKDQFLQVILLAQNRFQEFLLAKNDERQSVLRTLFGTYRFERYEAAIVERGKALQARLGDALEQRMRDAQRARDLSASSVEPASVGPASSVEPVETPADAAAPISASSISETASPADESLAWFEHGLTALAELLARANDSVAQAQHRADTDAAAHRELLDVRGRQRRRDEARQKLETVDAERDAIAEARASAQAAVRADAVAPQIVANENAEQALAKAVTAETDAREKYAAVAGDATTDATTLAAAIDELSRTLGALEEALADEAALPASEAELAAHRTRIEALEGELAKGAERAAALPELIRETGERLTAALVDAGRRAEAEASVARIREAVAGAAEAAAVAPILDVARRDEVAASTAHTSASRQLEQLLTRRLHGYAGELASGLTPGEPCAVCGSTEHPDPATPDAETVTDADLDNARDTLDARRAAFDTAAAHARELAETHAAALARAGGKETTALEAELADARASLDTAAAAAELATRLETELAALRQELDSAEAEQRAAQERRQQADAEQASAAARRDDLAQRVARQRGDHDTVAQRVAALTARLDAARTLAAAIASREETAAALDAATATLRQQLAEHGFETAAAASAARRAWAEQQHIDARIRTHEQSEAIARNTLAEPELADLPADPVETDAAADLAERSRAALSAAIGVRGSIVERHEQYGRLLDEVQKRFAGTAALSDEYEQIEGLAAAVQGKGSNTRRMRLETYVLAARLEEIVAAANGRLRTMTGGRYELQHDDSLQYRKTQSGLGLAILDQHTGRARATHSLSGGETFLASLALALGLAEVVTSQSGGITLDTLFVDEGFGSLDGDTLEIAMSTLDGLRAGGRTIGLISHVDAMKEQIPAKLGIRVTDGGWSEIEQQAAGAA